MEYLWSIIVASFWGPELLHFKKLKEILKTRSLLDKTLHENWCPKMFWNNRSHVNVPIPDFGTNRNKAFTFKRPQITVRPPPRDFQTFLRSCIKIYEPDFETKEFHSFYGFSITYIKHFCITRQTNMYSKIISVYHKLNWIEKKIWMYVPM